jgi:hypothetical protein
MLAMENVRYAVEAGTILQPPFESVKDLLGPRMRTQVWASVALRTEQFTALSQLLYAVLPGHSAIWWCIADAGPDNLHCNRARTPYFPL